MLLFLCRGVQLTRVAAAQGDFLLSAKLDPERYKYVRWRTTQRLKSGSLLAISRDHFKNHILFATVHDRDAKSMERNGTFVLKIDSGPISIFFFCELGVKSQPFLHSPKSFRGVSRHH